MKAYLDITLLPNDDIGYHFLWSKLFQQIHLGLVEQKTGVNESAIAISFPLYNNKVFPLGSKLRLLSNTPQQLDVFDAAKWLNRLLDYAHITSIKEVPKNVNQFSVFKRKQFKTNFEKLAKERASHKQIPLKEALEYITEKYDQACPLPFINMKSLSGDHQFKLFIDHELVDQKTSGVFNCYGLSSKNQGKQTTVPWFKQ